MSDLKPTNPKDTIGSGKLPLHLWPTTATIGGSLALLDGALKYGRSNWREAGIRASIYYDAARRHLDAWFEGEDADPISGLPHTWHAIACMALLIDGEAAGKLTDDRMYPGGYREFADAATLHVGRLKALHADHEAPHHYTATSETSTVPCAVLAPGSIDDLRQRCVDNLRPGVGESWTGFYERARDLWFSAPRYWEDPRSWEDVICGLRERFATQEHT